MTKEEAQARADARAQENMAKAVVVQEEKKRVPLGFGKRFLITWIVMMVITAFVTGMAREDVSPLDLLIGQATNALIIQGVVGLCLAIKRNWIK